MPIKTELSRLDKKALIEIISDLYKKNKSVQEYLDFYMEPDETGLIEKYRIKVFEAFYPKRGFEYNLKQGKQAISDFKKFNPQADLTVDLMLFYVETGVQFTDEYGDMNETYYSSLESTYAAALKFAYKEGLINIFKQRAIQILDDTRHMGWGFHDSLAETFFQFY